MMAQGKEAIGDFQTLCCDTMNIPLFIKGNFGKFAPELTHFVPLNKYSPRRQRSHNPVRFITRNNVNLVEA